MLGRGGPTIDYGESLKEFEGSEFAAWKDVHTKLNSAYISLKGKLKAVADSGSDADSLNECLEKAKAKIGKDIKEKTAYSGDVIGWSEKPSGSAVGFSPSLNFISPSASVTSISATAYEISIGILFVAVSAAQTSAAVADAENCVFKSRADGLWAFLSFGITAAEMAKNGAKAAKSEQTAEEQTKDAIATRLGQCIWI